MVSYTVETDVIIINKNGSKNRKTFYCMDADVTPSGNGFKINTPVPATDADVAYTKDTTRTFLYDQDGDIWYEQ